LTGSPVNESSFVGADHRLDAVAQPKFGEHLAEVGLHCRLGDVQPLGDFGVGIAAGELDQYFPFPGGELAEFGVGGCVCVLGASA
jgi:hypothetical protein